MSDMKDELARLEGQMKDLIRSAYSLGRAQGESEAVQRILTAASAQAPRPSLELTPPAPTRIQPPQAYPYGYVIGKVREAFRLVAPQGLARGQIGGVCRDALHAGDITDSAAIDALKRMVRTGEAVKQNGQYFLASSSEASESRNP